VHSLVASDLSSNFFPLDWAPVPGTMRHGGGDGKQYGTIVSTVSSNIVAALLIERSMFDGRLCGVICVEMYGWSRVTRHAVADFIPGGRSRSLVNCERPDSFMTVLLGIPDFRNRQCSHLADHG
jgi:hypothetical protein